MNHDSHNILLVAANYPPSRGGIQTTMRELACRLPAGSSVLAPAQQGDCEFDATLKCRTVRARLNRFHNYLAPIAVAKQLLAFRRRPPGMIICDHLVTAVAARMVRTILGSPYSLFVHGKELIPRSAVQAVSPRARLFRAALRDAHRVFVMSDYVLERVLEYGIPRRAIKRVPMGTDFNRFAPSKQSHEIRARHGLLGKPVIGTVGRVVQRKGHDQVIRALPHVLPEFPDLQYLVIGRGPYRRELQQLAGRLHLESHVHFLENISDEDLPHYLSTLDVMVMPSRQVGSDVEGFGIVFLEAGACMVPVVGGRSGGIATAIRDGETGLLCDPHSPQDIARCIMDLLSDPALSKRLGRSARQWVEQEMNWDNFAAVVLKELTAPVAHAVPCA